MSDISLESNWAPRPPVCEFDMKGKKAIGRGRLFINFSRSADWLLDIDCWQRSTVSPSDSILVTPREPSHIYGQSRFGRVAKEIYGTILRQIYARRTEPRVPGNSESILLVRIDAIGDFVVFTPALRHIRMSFPDSRIALVADEGLVDLASTCPSVDEVIPVNVRRYRRDFFYRVSFIRNLRQRAFDLVIHPTHSRTAEGDEVVYCSGAAKKVGIDGDLNNISEREKKNNDVYYTTLVKTPNKFSSEIDRNREFAAQITGTRIELADFQPELWLTESDRAAARNLLKDAGLDATQNPIATILPGAAWKGREWPTDGFAEVADRIVKQYGIKILILGSRADISVASNVASGMRAPCVSLAGKTRLRELAALLELCAFYIGNETGPLHMAVAAGIPTLCIIGGGHFGRFYPYGDLNRHRMVCKKMECFNCNWKCIHETVRCIQEITVEDVWQHTQRMIEEVVIPERESRAQTRSNGVTSLR
jgi:ADP-heptose:LPS heptosyltransferase